MEIIPVYISKFGAREKQIDLLLLKDADKTHYVWIKRMSALVQHRTKKGHAVFVCPHCIHPCSTEERFNRHLPDCSKFKRQVVLLPDEDKNELYWKSYCKTGVYPVCNVRRF